MRGNIKTMNKLSMDATLAVEVDLQETTTYLSFHATNLPTKLPIIMLMLSTLVCLVTGGHGDGERE